MPIRLYPSHAKAVGSFYTLIHVSQAKNEARWGLPPSALDWREWLKESFPEGGQGGSALDAGCGVNAYMARFCVEQDFGDVHAIDLNPEVEGVLTNNPKAEGIRYQVGSVLDMPFEDNRFDFVNCGGVAHHTPDPAKAVSEVYRVTKPGGLAWIALYTYRNSPFMYFNLALRVIGRLIPYKLMHRYVAHVPAFNGGLLDGMYVPIMWMFYADEVREMLNGLGFVIEQEWVVNYDFFYHKWRKALGASLTGDGLIRTFSCRKPA